MSHGKTAVRSALTRLEYESMFGMTHVARGRPACDTIESLADEIRQCTNCNLCETRKNAVPGEGGTSGGILFVGEAPGAEEDARASVYMIVVMSHERQFIEVQGTAEQEPFSRDALESLLALAERGIELIKERQLKALGGSITS